MGELAGRRRAGNCNAYQNKASVFKSALLYESTSRFYAD
jgi:hypothetical protein